MNDEQIIEYLRSRAQVEPPPDLVTSVLNAVDRAPRRRSWFAPFVPAFAAAGAVAVILALAVLIGQDRPPSGSISSPSEDPSVRPTASATSTAEPTTSAAPTAEPTQDPFGSSVFEDPDNCEDDSVGYRVAFPDAWWWNEPFESEIGPHANCRYFAPAEFDATTVSQEQPVPEGVAIHVLVIAPDGDLGQSGEVILSEELTVAGQPALREEQEATPGGFLAPGERLYRYVIELPEERQLVFTAGNLTGDYDENREVLDGMMATLELSEPGEICGPEGDQFVCGQILIGLTDDADVPIETVVERNGGDPAADILERTPEIGAYVIAVPHGSETDFVRRYLLDDAVDYAELNGAEGEVVDQ